MKLTVTDAAKQWGITRNTVYNNINNGKLSRDSNKMIDVAEMIRVFGEPEKNTRVEVSNITQNLASSITHANTHELELEQLKTKHLEELLEKQELVNKDYRQQIEHYQRQVEQLNDNLCKANTSIQELAHNRLIGMESEKQTEGVTPSSSANERVTAPELTQPTEQVATTELTAKKRKKWRWW